MVVDGWLNVYYTKVVGCRYKKRGRGSMKNSARHWTAVKAYVLVNFCENV